MDDPGHQAERQPGDREPPTPHQRRGPQSVGARRPPRPQQQRAEREQCGGQQPRRLPAELGAEQPGQPGLAPATAGRAADAADLRTGQPPQAVVAENELQHAVGLRPADEGPVVGGPQLDDEHPPARAHHQRDRREREVAQPPSPSDRRADEPHERQRGQHEERLQHLGEEPEPDQGGGQQQPARSALLDGAQSRVPRGHQQQGEQRVRVVEPEDQHGDRGHGERRAREQRRTRREPGSQSACERAAAHRRVKQPHRRHAHQRLRREHAPRGEPEEPHGEAVDPQRRGCLVDGDPVGRVGRTEEPGLHAHARGLRGGGVEGVGPAGRGQVPQVQPGRRDQQGAERAVAGTQASRPRGGGGWRGRGGRWGEGRRHVTRAWSSALCGHGGRAVGQL